MDAVRRFMETEGGRVELHLGELLDPEREYYSFHFLITLPSHDSSANQTFVA